jgi:ABC-2 type transport system permease protein
MATTIVPGGIYKGWLFIRRGYLTMLSYRTALVLALFTGLVSLLQFGFMAGFLAEGNTFPALDEYGGSLLGFLIIGSDFTGFVGVSLNSFQGAISSEQQMGTLEHLLMSDTPLGHILLYSALWSFLNTLVNSAVLFLFVSLIFNLSLKVNLLATAVVLLLTILSMSGIGLISAGIIMITKRGDPVGWVFTTLTGLLSGVLFPVSVLPPYLQVVSALLPTTHALRALRLTLLNGVVLNDIWPELIFLTVTCCLTIPLGLLAFRVGFDKARKTGSLGQY